MKKIVAALLAAALLFCLFGCGEAPQTPQETTVPKETLTGPVIGICLPEESDFWKTHAAVLEACLWEKNYRTEVLYAGNDPLTQARQVKELVQTQVGGLVITPVDSMALQDSLRAAQEANIPVVAYDRLLMRDDTVDGFVSFDYEEMGRQAGQYIVAAKDLENAEEELRSYNIEFFMGSAEDHRAFLFHRGLLEILQPYLDAKVLKSLSGRTTFADTYVLLSDPDLAAEKLTASLESFYGKKSLDIICFASDEMAAGCRDILTDYAQDKTFPPLVTGAGGTVSGLRQLSEGALKMSIYQDYNALAEACAQMVDTLVTGKTLTAADKTNNQAVQVPTVLCPIQLVDENNYQELLIDSGIYSQEDLS